MPARSHELTRAFVLRGLAAIYAVAFTVALTDGPGLIGSRGLMPAAAFLGRLRTAWGPICWWRLPTLFWLGAGDGALELVAVLGLVLSLVSLLGPSSALIYTLLWAGYLSFVHVGQIFWGYGWESLLCEAGFLAIFLCGRIFVRGAPARTPLAVIWLYRWLLFRVLLGAGLIKLRGDSCWRDLTCMVYHYETQPLPNPISPLLHRMPLALHKLGVLFTHFVELIVPFGLLAGGSVAAIGGALAIVFQLLLIASGNLSWLNYLTIVIALSCFDDALLARLLPSRLRRPRAPDEPSRARQITVALVTLLVGALSTQPMANMMSPHQRMNSGFDPLLLVNSYGAFGSVGRERDELVIEGTADQVTDEHTEWRAYELPCKPGAVARRPCVVAPLQPRLDWQLWFAAMSDAEHEPWLLHLVDVLLHGGEAARDVKRLLAFDPFARPDAPPRWIRVLRYRYRFAPPGSRDWWQRELIGTFLEPVGLEPVAAADPDAAWVRYRQPDRLLAALAAAPGQTVADVGAGHGELTVRLAAAVGPRGHVVATDIDADALAALRERAHQAGVTVETRQVTADTPELEPTRYDGIMLSEVDHLLADRAEYLRRLAAALKPGGRLVVTNRRAFHAPLLAAAHAAGLRVVGDENDLPAHFIVTLQADGR